MKKFLTILAAAFLMGSATAQGEDPPGDETVPESPEIVFVEPVAWDDPVPWGGIPPPWFEDPASVDCGGREACEAALANATTVDA